MSKNSDLRYVSFNRNIRPKVVEQRYNDWVLNGINNSFYKYLIDMYYGSITHSTVIDSYINLIYGRGISVNETGLDSVETKNLLKYISKKDLIKIITDYYIFGEFSMQIIRKGGRKLDKLKHINKDRLAPSLEDENGEITSYWYSRDWANQYKKFGKGGVINAKPVRYPALGFGEKGETEIFVAKPYKVGKEYFSDPSYLAALPYAEFEEEVANFYLKYIKNGLSLGHIINVPNSTHWSDEAKDAFIKKATAKTQGSSNAGGVIYAFNSAQEPTTIESIKNEYAHNQWEFLTKEARQQILTRHLVTSPSLFGIISSSGFSSTSDEMDEAEHQLMKRVISPLQNFVIDSIREVLDYFGQDVEFEFLPLTEKVDAKEATKEVDEEVALKKKDELELFLLKGEDEDLENYNIVDEIEVDYNEKLEFASTGTARPNAKSEQDSDDIIIRYRYVGNIKSDTRSFCGKMLAAKKIYRKEDIIQLDNKVVNAGWGANGADTYSIWLYKGGGSCHHKWNRVIYLKKGKSVDVNSPLAKTISTSEARRKGFKVPTNDTLVSVEPRNMKNNGFLKPRK